MRLIYVHHTAEHYGVPKPAKTRINVFGGGLSAEDKRRKRQENQRARKALRKQPKE